MLGHSLFDFIFSPSYNLVIDYSQIFIELVTAVRYLAQEQFDNLMMAFIRGGLESVAIFAALRINNCSIVQK
jgi:hypothetical protein